MKNCKDAFGNTFFTTIVLAFITLLKQPDNCMEHVTISFTAKDGFTYEEETPD